MYGLTTLIMILIYSLFFFNIEVQQITLNIDLNCVLCMGIPKEGSRYIETFLGEVPTHYIGLKFLFYSFGYVS